MESMIDKLNRFIGYEKDAMLSDDPNGTCAASHRGEIRAYERVIKWLLDDMDNMDSEEIAACGHLERFWKVEPNQDAWCLQCFIEAQAIEIQRLREALEFYADEKSWYSGPHGDDFSVMDVDKGDKACEALNRKPDGATKSIE